MKLALAMSSGSTDSIDVSETLFNRDFNEALVHQVVTALQAGNRAGTKAQKNRSDVSGGGAKPWRQKGTGRARAGTIRSPIWRGGGKTFASSPRNFEQKINRKMYQGAMRSILSELVRQDRVRIVDSFEVSEPKTKVLVEKLKGMELSATLIVMPVIEDNLYLAQRNLPKVSITTSQQLTPLKLLQYDHVILSVDALRKLEETLV
tara:strand:- start:22989 stop:23603 length:615 start_codon:yes stop_codon:yes gene_type:complete